MILRTGDKMLEVQKLTDDELKFLSWGIERIPGYLVSGYDSSIRDNFLNDIKDELKKRTS